MITTQQMQEIYDGVLRKKQISLADGGVTSLSYIREAFAAMRQQLDAEGATQDQKASFRARIERAIDEGIWRVKEQRSAVLGALASAFDGFPQGDPEQQVAVGALTCVQFYRWRDFGSYLLSTLGRPRASRLSVRVL